MRRALLAALAVLLACAASLLVAAPASAHVVPSTVIALDVHESDITASMTLPASDLSIASGIEITDAVDATTAEEIEQYLEEHFAVTSDNAGWTVAVDDVSVADTEQWGTGEFAAVTATATLTPPATADLRAFTLDYDAIIHQVVTADIYVTLHTDWASGELESARDLGTITTDTVSGAVAPLSIDLDDGSLWQGFAGMVGLGISHIAEGTDHQLFLLTLLLPAPLIALRGRWRGVARPRTTIRRILTITLAFTIGHSATLALGTLGLPVPQQAVEALIAVSILVAAAHAIRPLFPGREALVAGLFGLIHGMAFSTTLTALDLNGGQLALSLLGFNIGIELMQLLVVALVLPPLVLLARTRIYTPLRIIAASITALAAVGWLVDRLGVPNAIGEAADALGVIGPALVLALWLAGIVVAVRRLVPRTGRSSARDDPRALAPLVDGTSERESVVRL
ncbi:HupE/UreJ family protein [Microbacterium allomyrinae]|uniref:HupE/UreJ family protein n=1 Tax=Microbacterium allomyrinae TaxID=2830666 RepID=A0A9X1LTU9_9MICO|nr:HupE/UreJ family protein [Microbacterium allomyrinae]MCC2031568.1 HupE/UreJ family protein [Microbacterium allomyrinae]